MRYTKISTMFLLGASLCLPFMGGCVVTPRRDVVVEDRRPHDRPVVVEERRPEVIVEPRR